LRIEGVLEDQDSKAQIPKEINQLSCKEPIVIKTPNHLQEEQKET